MDNMIELIKEWSNNQEFPLCHITVIKNSKKCIEVFYTNRDSDINSVPSEDIFGFALEIFHVVTENKVYIGPSTIPTENLIERTLDLFRIPYTKTEIFQNPSKTVITKHNIK